MEEGRDHCVDSEGGWKGGLPRVGEREEGLIASESGKEEPLPEGGERERENDL